MVGDLPLAGSICFNSAVGFSTQDCSGTPYLTSAAPDSLGCAVNRGGSVVHVLVRKLGASPATISIASSLGTAGPCNLNTSSGTWVEGVDLGVAALHRAPLGLSLP